MELDFKRAVNSAFWFKSKTNILFDFAQKEVSFQENDTTYIVKEVQTVHEEWTKHFGSSLYLLHGKDSQGNVSYDAFVDVKHERLFHLRLGFLNKELFLDVDVGWESLNGPSYMRPPVREEWKERLYEMVDYLLEHFMMEDSPCRLYFLTQAINYHSSSWFDYATHRKTKEKIQ